MQQFEAETHLSDYVRIIKSKKNVAITFFFATVFIVTIGSLLMKPVYRATVTLFVDVESPDVLTASGSIALDRPDYYAYKEYLQSQKEVIKSRSFARRVFEEFNLAESQDFSNAKDPISDFIGAIKVQTVRDTRLLLLSVENRDPKLAAGLTNRLAEIYIAHNLAYITKSELVNLHKNEYLKLQTRLTEYSKIYKHKHPKMIRLKKEIVQMAGRIKQEQERVESYAMANSAANSSSFDESASDMSGPILAGLKANNITIQDPAEVPLWPIRPKKRLNVLLAVVVGFFGGVGLAFFFDYLDDTIKGIEDVEKLAQWPFLGNIPKIDKGNRLSELEKDLFVHTKPKDPIAEAYRTARTSVLFSSTQEHPLRSMIVTSPGPQEGKTTTLCNLGITMAQSEKRVLMVDADMRKPRLHEIFNKKNDVGLSSFLSEQADFDALVQKTKVENISLVSGGPHPPNPSELLSSRKMNEFIEQAKAKFDVILIDTPPIAVVTDAVILSQTVDGTIIVLESGKTNRRTLPRISQVLKDARARIIGVLLNKVILTGGGYYTYYYGKRKQDASGFLGST